MDLKELRKKIHDGEIDFEEKVISSGSINNSEGFSSKYKITHGWNPCVSADCDKYWELFNLQVFEFIKNQNYTKDELKTVLGSIQLEHRHWDWLAKSCKYMGDEYEWFFILAENKPQGACLIFHPKASLLEKGDIFYIEYLATAPWNRDNPIQKRKYKGIGTRLLKCVLHVAINELKLKAGFSLHSLPQACGYYEMLGMSKCAGYDKDGLTFFEMLEQKALSLLGGGAT